MNASTLAPELLRKLDAWWYAHLNRIIKKYDLEVITCTRSQKMTNLLRNGNVSDPSHVRLRRMLKKPRNASTGSA